ncbi:MAG: putative bifunctional diguanylate cyclase/phosphodiesterase [Acidimicrobiales bacterium]
MAQKAATSGVRTWRVAVAAAFVTVVCLCCSFVVNDLLAETGRHHQAQLDLAAVRCTVSTLSAQEWAGMAGVLGDLESTSVAADEAEVRLAELADTAAAADRAELAAVAERFGSYRAAVTKLLVLLQQGERAEAAALDAEVVDPTFDELTELLERTSARLDARAAAAAARTRRGAFGSVSLAVATLALVALQVIRVGRRLSASQAQVSADARQRLLLSYSEELVLVIDAEQRVTYKSRSVERILGYPWQAEAPPGWLNEIVHPDHRAQVRAVLARVQEAPGRTATLDCRVRRSDGDWRDLTCHLANLSAAPEIGGVLVNARDVTERLRLQRNLSHQASHDALTGLANRARFTEALAEHRDRDSRNSRASRDSRDGRNGRAPAVLLVDLDGFKDVNDSLGHEAGDRVLTHVAARLASIVRKGDLVARLGSDEFAVLLAEPSAEELAAVAERIIAKIQTPIVTSDGARAIVGASIGAAMSEAGGDPLTLLHQADVALYEAKRLKKGSWVRFDAQLHARVEDRAAIRQALARALENGGLEAAYQPIHRLTDHRVDGFEALVRWYDPVRGAMSPGDFIPIAEESGQVVQLGRWMLDRAAAQLRRWSELQPALTMAVNVSPRQLLEPGFVDDVAATILRHEIPPDRLVLELTETMLIESPDDAAAVLQQLRDLGVQLALDDYGAGHTSVNYLRRFPLDVIKIDRSFTADLDRGRPDTAALVRSITDLARALGLETIVEGIEEPEQQRLARELGCDFGQGYLFAKPMDPQAATDYLAAALVPAHR